MNRVTITLHIDLPDGITPDVAYGVAPAVSAAIAAFDEPPLPDAPPPDLFEAPQALHAPATPVSGAPLCPDGHGQMKYIPGGFSKTKKTDNGLPKPYDAFYGCNDRDCKRTAKAA